MQRKMERLMLGVTQFFILIGTGLGGQGNVSNVSQNMIPLEAENDLLVGTDDMKGVARYDNKVIDCMGMNGKKNMSKIKNRYTFIK